MEDCPAIGGGGWLGEAPEVECEPAGERESGEHSAERPEVILGSCGCAEGPPVGLLVVMLAVRVLRWT